MKKFSLLFATLFCAVLSMSAQNKLTVTDVTIAPGAEETVTVGIDVTEEIAGKAIQVDVYASEGLTLVADSWSTGSDITAALSSYNVRDDGALRAGYESANVEEGSHTLFTFKVKADETFSAGTLTFKNIKIADVAGDEFTAQVVSIEMEEWMGTLTAEVETANQWLSVYSALNEITLTDFEDAIAAAEEVLNSEEATVAEVKAAAETLYAAMAAYRTAATAEVAEQLTNRVNDIEAALPMIDDVLPNAMSKFNTVLNAVKRAKDDLAAGADFIDLLPDYQELEVAYAAFTEEVDGFTEWSATLENELTLANIWITMYPISEADEADLQYAIDAAQVEYDNIDANAASLEAAATTLYEAMAAYQAAANAYYLAALNETIENAKTFEAPTEALTKAIAEAEAVAADEYADFVDYKYAQEDLQAAIDAYMTTTGINSFSFNANEGIYNVNGAKLNGAAKGLNIVKVNGKTVKVIVK